MGDGIDHTISGTPDENLTTLFPPPPNSTPREAGVRTLFPPLSRCRALNGAAEGRSGPSITSYSSRPYIAQQHRDGRSIDRHRVYRESNGNGKPATPEQALHQTSITSDTSDRTGASHSHARGLRTHRPTPTHLRPPASETAEARLARRLRHASVESLSAEPAQGGVRAQLVHFGLCLRCKRRERDRTQTTETKGLGGLIDAAVTAQNNQKKNVRRSPVEFGYRRRRQAQGSGITSHHVISFISKVSGLISEG